MARYSQESKDQLATTHPDLQRVLNRCVRRFDNKVLEGKRTSEQQAENVRKRVSKTMFSRHLPEHSEDPAQGVDAVDAAPYPVRWPKPRPPEGATEKEFIAWMKDWARFYHWGGYVLGRADEMFERGEISKPIHWGGDWDGDRDVHDQDFNDLPHFQRGA